MSDFWRGLLLGLSIAAPVGPIGVLCIRRTLAHGRAAGFTSGLGAATADAFYGTVAGFGLTAISNIMVGGQQWFRVIGGTFLCYLGARTWLSTPAVEARGATARGLLGNYASTFVLTLTNPMTILSFAAIFAGLGITAAGRYSTAALLVGGVFCGSALWWLILSSATGTFRERLSIAGLRWVNRLSGAIITGFGMLALLAVR